MRLRRIYAAFLCILLCALCAGCGADRSDAEGSSAQSASSGLPELEITDDLQTIIDRGYMTAAVRGDSPDLGLLDDETGEYSGGEIQLSYYIASRIFDVSYDEAVSRRLVHFIPASDSNVLSVLTSGQVDYVIAACARTEEREQLAELSDCYYAGSLALMINRADSSVIHSAADLDGVNVGVIQGHPARDELTAYLSKNCSGVSPIYREYADYSELSSALASGEIDVAYSDLSILRGYTGSSNIILADRIAPQQYCTAVRLGNDGLIDAADLVIAELAYKQIYLFP